MPTRAVTVRCCVIETPADVLAVEQSTGFQGLYFVLMGHLSPLDGIGPAELGLEMLEARLDEGEVREMILATNPTVEGEATAYYIAELARERGIRATASPTACRWAENWSPWTAARWRTPLSVVGICGVERSTHHERLHFLQDRRWRDPADIVYDDGEVLAFRDINPEAPVHLLLIPRRHIATLNDLNRSGRRAGWSVVFGGPADSVGIGCGRKRLPYRNQLQSRRWPTRLPYPHAFVGGPGVGLAAGLNPVDTSGFAMQIVFISSCQRLSIHDLY